MDAFLRRKLAPQTSQVMQSCGNSLQVAVDDRERPAKKRRLSNDTQSDTEIRSAREPEGADSVDSPLVTDLEFLGDNNDGPGSGLEGAFVDIGPGTEVIESDAESQLKENSDTSKSRRWIKGQSSIYVDAFNLALDTVLEDESHLFDERERRVFDEWKGLDYQSQYLCASLFEPETFRI
jgi:Fanconi-associated nuclease 1